MCLKIGGDTLALDADIRHQIEAETQKLADRFPDETFDLQCSIQEEFDQLHGHRVRCELSAKLGSGRQMVARDARKSASEAISEVFSTTRRNIRRLRRPYLLNPSPATQTVTRVAQAVGG